MRRGGGEKRPEVAVRGNGMEHQPHRGLLFDDRPLLLDQHRRHNLIIGAAAGNNEGDQGGLEGSQAGVISSGLNVRTFMDSSLGVEKGDAGGGGAVGRVRVIGGFQRGKR